MKRGNQKILAICLEVVKSRGLHIGLHEKLHLHFLNNLVDKFSEVGKRST